MVVARIMETILKQQTGAAEVCNAGSMAIDRVAPAYSALRYSSVMVTVRLKERASGDRLSKSASFEPTPE
jgi:hypothetical protein